MCGLHWAFGGFARTRGTSAFCEAPQREAMQYIGVSGISPGHQQDHLALLWYSTLPLDRYTDSTGVSGCVLLGASTREGRDGTALPIEG